MSEIVRRGFLVRGRVQGVGFRWWTRRVATQLGLRGTVRNRLDGSVEVRAEGPRDSVDRLREVLRQGPPGARVTAVEEFDVTGPLPERFEIVA